MLTKMGIAAKKASRFLATATTEQKDNALNEIAKGLINDTENILLANEKDIKNGKENGLSDSLLDRLALTVNRIEDISKGVLEIIELTDPVGKIDAEFTRPNGLSIKKVRVPMGVIGIIYEARPNVTADAATLCLKAGNAVILRGGKEAINSNIAIAQSIRASLKRAGFPEDCVCLITDTTRESSNALMRLNKYLDVLIPRGGAGLIRAVVENSSVPVIETGSGNCHLYVDKFADKNKAVDIVFNAKTSRVSVCNAAETLLIHKDIASDILPLIKTKLDEKNVEIRGCETTCKILGEDIIPATDEDFATEFLDYIISVKVVDSLCEAIDHITKYSTGHSECIITECPDRANKFTANIDSAAVYVNASTRFTDGGEFGFGAEIGISTQKLHARGPMGINELTSFKYIINGQGQVR
ncbi:MAG: glutamate-5-semialdehyde dehydrogenase [Clostridia bacterium]|nr:glutamate-5-semialdehyde dehydrogenase [Clostridia bacterium]